MMRWRRCSLGVAMAALYLGGCSRPSSPAIVIPVLPQVKQIDIPAYVKIDSVRMNPLSLTGESRGRFFTWRLVTPGSIVDITRLPVALKSTVAFVAPLDHYRSTRGVAFSVAHYDDGGFLAYAADVGALVGADGPLTDVQIHALLDGIVPGKVAPASYGAASTTSTRPEDR